MFAVRFGAGSRVQVVPKTLVCGTILLMTENKRLTPVKTPCQNHFGFDRFLALQIACHPPSSLLKNPLGL
jgi:hypothetical protein